MRLWLEFSKWSGKDNEYFRDFRTKIIKPEPDRNILSTIFIYLSLLILGFILGKYLPLKKQRIDNLSVQERKILQELENGASNKEISEKFNIGVSTVKSHVSSILSKMNAKSRKDLMNTK